MNTAISEARALFASMPAEVFDGWLVEGITVAGWPSSGARWDARLAGYSSQEWASFSWSKEEIDLASLVFSEEAIRIVKGLSAARFANEQNAYANIENSAARMQNIYSHIKQSRRLPGSVVLINGSPWEIVDGCHRITMYLAWLRHKDLSHGIERVQSAWVARPKTSAQYAQA